MLNDETETDQLFADLLDFESLSDRYLTRALLTKQYLPNVKKEGEEFPPFFSSESFGVEVAEALSTLEPKGAEWVEIRTRRFDGLIRRFGIPHPVPYSKLVLHLREHWSDLNSRLDDERSQIRPQWHDDGRVIQMDYVEQTEEHSRYTRLAQGNSYLVKADISNCFPSIYSHALDWSLRGKEIAKRWVAAPRKKRTSSWEATLDELSRNVSNRETKGLLIGPAVSNILSELILQRIDEELGDYDYVRYIDDYSAYFESREAAEEFLVHLQRALSKFRLDLNTRKTKVVSLRSGSGDAWMGEILSHLPAEWSDLSAARFLQHAEKLAQDFPSTSVMKFATRTLLGHCGRPEGGSLYLVDELVRITQFHPHLLPLLSQEVAKLQDVSASEQERIAAVLRQHLVRAIRAGETDSVLWLLFIINRQLDRPLKLGKTARRDLLGLDDDYCLLAFAGLSSRHADHVERHMRSRHWLDEGERQSHWLARYELWCVDRIEDDELSGEEARWMRVLKDKGVRFSEL